MGNCFSQLKKNKVSPKVGKYPAKRNGSRLSLFFGREKRNTEMIKSELEAGEKMSGGLTITVSASEATLETKLANPRSDTSLQDILDSSFLLDNETKPKHADNVYDADQLIQELDKINDIHLNRQATANIRQEIASYECNEPRPKTRRGPVTGPRGQSCSMDKNNSGKMENDSQYLKREARNKQQASVVPLNCAREKAAVKKCVQFAYISDVSDGLDKVIDRPSTPVYDDKERGLIDEIEEEYGIK